MPKKPVLIKAPLTPACFVPLPLKAVRPQGGLLLRLKEAARWAGGMAFTDGSLPGFAALALLTEDPALLKQAQARVEALLAAGIGDEAMDLASQASLLQGLMDWYGATSDGRVLEYVLRRLKDIKDRAETLFSVSEAAALTGEFACVAVQAYGYTGKQFLLKLLEKLRALGLDWTTFFVSFPLTRPFAKHIPPEEMARGLAAPDEATRLYYQKQRIMADGLTLAKGLKAPAVFSRFSGGGKEKEAGQTGLLKVMRYHGTAHGLFAAEPSLMGGDPACGMDGRAVAEAMFSLEQLLIALGDGAFFDALEKIALNILPAMEKNGLIRPVQRVNGPFPSAGMPAGEMGPFVDAWLKGMAVYASSLWMAAPEDGLALMGYAPSLLRWKVKGTLLTARVEGSYPLDGEVSVTFRTKTPVSFPLQLRVPAWAQGASLQVNGGEMQELAAGSFFTLRRTFEDGDRIGLRLPMAPRLTRWHHQSVAMEYGPLLMALSVDGEQPLWQLALDDKAEMRGELAKGPEGERLTVSAAFRQVPGWTEKDGKPQSPPVKPGTKGEAMRLVLTPYGETVCRMAQFPLAPED